MFMDNPVLPCETLTACALFAPPVAPAASPAATSKETPVASIATPSHTFRVIAPPLEPYASMPASGGLLRFLQETAGFCVVRTHREDLGSKASRNPSPSRLNASVVSRTARPGQSISQGCVV